MRSSHKVPTRPRQNTVPSTNYGPKVCFSGLLQFETFVMLIITNILHRIDLKPENAGPQTNRTDLAPARHTSISRMKMIS